MGPAMCSLEGPPHVGGFNGGIQTHNILIISLFNGASDVFAGKVRGRPT